MTTPDRFTCPPNAEPRRADTLKRGDVVLGTARGDAYPVPRKVLGSDHVPEHSQRMAAYRLAWANAKAQVYYGDTVVWVQVATP